MEPTKAKHRLTLLLLLAVLLFGGVPLLQGGAGAQDSPAVPGLSDDQCANCHTGEPAAIAARGGLHRDAVGCQDCHQEHPPQGAAAIPSCGACHAGEPHYELENCSGCHENAHAPLDLTMEGDITGPCLTCHEQQGMEMERHPSMHGQVSCTFCHAEHKQVPGCMDCHAKHEESMTQQDCASCHPAHQPLEVTYDKQTPDPYCGACHDQAFNVLSMNTSKHNDLSCVHCHRDQHKTIPPCFACHSKPHPDEMLQKFNGCGDCHGTAHDMRR
jgi:predicted CXXCH cytochrome family protein